MSETSGQNLPASYAVYVDSAQRGSLGPNAMLLIPQVAAGSHQVTLLGATAHCSTPGGEVRTAEVQAGDTTTVSYVVTCGTVALPLVRRILFISDRDGHPQLYVMDPDGSHQTRLVGDTSAQHGFDVSADGARVAVEESAGIYAVNADGTLRYQVCRHCDNPRWSPSGSVIAFVTPVHPEGIYSNDALAVANPDGSSVRLLTAVGLDIQYHSWSPDGRLAYGGLRPAFDPYPHGAIGVVGAWHLETQAAGDAKVLEPAFSPAGDRIAFSDVALDSSGTAVIQRIFVINADGSGLRPVSPAVLEAADHPAWSPDGARIAFATHDYVTDTDRIFLMDADGSHLTPVDVRAPLYSLRPRWSPDGQTLTFSAARDGYRALYAMNADGTGIVQLTGNPWNDYDPRWTSQ